MEWNNNDASAISAHRVDNLF